MLKHIPHPRLVRLTLDGTGADYTNISKNLLDKKKTTIEGVTVAGVTFYGDIRGIDADLLEKAEVEEDWKWRMYIDLLPRVQRTDGFREPDEELDAVTREIGKDLPVIREYNEEVRAELHKRKMESK